MTKNKSFYEAWVKHQTTISIVINVVFIALIAFSFEFFLNLVETNIYVQVLYFLAGATGAFYTAIAFVKVEGVLKRSFKDKWLGRLERVLEFIALGIVWYVFAKGLQFSDFNSALTVFLGAVVLPALIFYFLRKFMAGNSKDVG